MTPGPIPAPIAEDPQGPGPGGGFVSPAPPVEDMRASNALTATLTIVAQSRRLANDYPQVSPEAQQINDIVSRMQMKIKGSQQRPETQAPPV